MAAVNGLPSLGLSFLQVGVVIVSLCNKWDRLGKGVCDSITAPVPGFSCPCTCFSDAEPLVGRRPRPGRAHAMGRRAQVCGPGPRRALVCGVDSTESLVSEAAAEGPVEGPQTEREDYYSVGGPSGPEGGMAAAPTEGSRRSGLFPAPCIESLGPPSSPGADAVTLTLWTVGVGGPRHRPSQAESHTPSRSQLGPQLLTPQGSGRAPRGLGLGGRKPYLNRATAGLLKGDRGSAVSSVPTWSEALTSFVSMRLPLGGRAWVPGRR